MTPPAPRHELDRYGHALWHAAYTSAVRHGIWKPHFALGLETLASAAAQYVRAAMAGGSDDPDLRTLRVIIREQLFQWHLIDDERLPELRPDGVDPDIARACGLPPTVH